jgi:peptide deformylase
MRYDIVTYGDPVLRRKADPVEKIDDGIRSLATDMIDTMRSANGLGLAAQQLGKTVAVCVMDVPQNQDNESAFPTGGQPVVIVNPEITSSSEKVSAEEGCLSFPGIFSPITRARNVTVEYLDLDGAVRQLHASGLVARVIQHEVDHLNGVLLVDRMSPIKKVSLAGKLKAIRKRQAKSAR